MSNPQKRKGDKAELEVQGILRDLLGVPARRELGAGRLDDCGDMHGVPQTCVSVKNYRSLDDATSRAHMDALERQQKNARADFAAMFCRRVGGRYVVVMTPEMFSALWREATAPTVRIFDGRAWDAHERAEVGVDVERQV